jgi:hypothetical protein
MSPDIARLSPADWRRGITDPVLFAKRVLNVNLHAGQQRWICRSAKRENLLVTGNRWGKSFVSAVKLLHRAVYRQRPRCYDSGGRYRMLIGSITQDQACIIFDTVVRLARQSAWLEPLIRTIRRTPYPRLTFGNGATIDARTTQNRGQYLLGNDYDFVVFDEVAFETDPDYVVEEVIQMRLADRQGTLDLVSTPNGKNWFYRRMLEGKEHPDSKYVQSGDSRENRYISSEYLDERVRYFSESRLKQNIMGQFVDSGGEIIKGAYVDAALRRHRESGLPSLSQSVPLLTGWDLARKRTATVGVTVAVVDGKVHVVALERYRDFDWPIVIERICKRQRDYPGRCCRAAVGVGRLFATGNRVYTAA